MRPPRLTVLIAALALVGAALAVPAAQAQTPPLTIVGSIPCGGSGAAQAWYERWYPKLEAVMGEPFTVGAQGLTWRWDGSGGGHGWDPATNTIWFTPGENRSCDPNDNNDLFRSYFREVAHETYDTGADNLNFGPQWLRQALVGLALWQSGEESGEPIDTLDRLAFAGAQKVNGTYMNGDKYGDQIGSHGRSWIDASGPMTMTMLTQVFGADLLKRLNAAIEAYWQQSGSNDLLPQTLAQLLDQVTGGRTIDGQKPGEWLLAQPVANAQGQPGSYVALNATYSDSGSFGVSAFSRAIRSSDGRAVETPLANAPVTVSLLDPDGRTVGSTQTTIPADGDTDVSLDRLVARDQSRKVYLVKASSPAAGGLADTNIYLAGPPPSPDELIVVPVNADASALRPELVPAIQVRGARRINDAPAGELVLQATPGANVQLSVGSWHATYTKPADARVIPVRIDAPAVAPPPPPGPKAKQQPKKKPPLCKKGQRPSAKKPCRRR